MFEKEKGIIRFRTIPHWSLIRQGLFPCLKTVLPSGEPSAGSSEDPAGSGT